ncbi:DNA invertase Pin-like site-specific DNA recombinase [Bradyrhizobium sp. USDA 4518]
MKVAASQLAEVVLPFQGGAAWPPERVQAIDEDLGKSAAGGVDRHGFQKLIAEIGLGSAVLR